jgi:hypothetical protein
VWRGLRVRLDCSLSIMTERSTIPIDFKADGQSPKALDRLATISRRGTAPLDLVYDCVTEEPVTGLGSWTTPGFWHLAPIAAVGMAHGPVAAIQLARGGKSLKGLPTRSASGSLRWIGTGCF